MTGFLSYLLAALAALSLVLLVWQCLAAWRFPLHRRRGIPATLPGITLFKPLKGCDNETAACLETWLGQDYPGPRQILFGVASAADPVCAVVEELLQRHIQLDARLVICSKLLGPNAKVSTLAQLEPLAKYDLICVSDADVRAEEDLVAQAVTQFQETKGGLVSCIYRLAHAATTPTRLEAVGVNVDFWSQALQARTLKPLDFALGAVMVTTREQLQKIGGFAALLHYMADDYQLGNKIARAGATLELCPIVAECGASPVGWRAVWAHQLRWARTIRVCQPVPYFFSILSNATMWPLLFMLCAHTSMVQWNLVPDWVGMSLPVQITIATNWGALFFVGALGLRMITAALLQRRLNRTCDDWPWVWLVPVHDLFRTVIWAAAFLGNTVVWRGARFRVEPGGTLVWVENKASVAQGRMPRPLP